MRRSGVRILVWATDLQAGPDLFRTLLRDPCSDHDLGATEWSLGGFHIINRDDILFQSTGGVSSNERFFANVDDTRRLGVELGLNGEKGPVSWFLNYSYADARFQGPFLVSSPNHPSANDQTAVEDGDRIPSIPNTA